MVFPKKSFLVYDDVDELSPKGGTRRCRDTAFTWCVWESPRSQCGQGGSVLLALACSAARRLGESAPRWPAGSPAQWQRPQMRGRGCVRTRGRIAKPRWRWVRIGHAKRTSELATWEMRLKKVIQKKTIGDLGCEYSEQSVSLVSDLGWLREVFPLLAPSH